MIRLLANASHIIQPCDVSLFKPLKEKWENACNKSWKTHSKVENFSARLLEIWRKIPPYIMRNGFRSAGLYPLDPNAVK